MRIVSHPVPRHFDDYIALCVLKTIFHDVNIIVVHPQSVPDEYLRDRDTVLVDVGMSYDPHLNNFDHHQDQNLPCSAILVVRHFTDINTDSLLLRTVDVVDRFGIQRAVNEGLIKNTSGDISFIRRVILHTEITETVARTVYSNLRHASSTTSLDDFIYSLQEELASTDEFRRAEQAVLGEKEAYLKRFKEVKIIEVDGIKVAISHNSLAPFHSEFFKVSNVDLLIEKNPFNPHHTSLIINTFSSRRTEAYVVRERIISGLPEVFRHKGQFIVVVDVPIDRIKS